MERSKSKKKRIPLTSGKQLTIAKKHNYETEKIHNKQYNKKMKKLNKMEKTTMSKKSVMKRTIRF